jgi:hypothetical protein
MLRMRKYLRSPRTVPPADRPRPAPVTWFGAVKRSAVRAGILAVWPCWRVEGRATCNLLLCGTHMTEAGARIQFDRMVDSGKWREVRLTCLGRIVAHWQDGPSEPAEFAALHRGCPA